MQTPGTALFLLGALVYLVGGLAVALAIRGAGPSNEWVGALVGGYIFPPIQWFLVAKHWKAVKSTLVVQLAGVLLLTLGLVFGVAIGPRPWLAQSIPITTTTIRSERFPYSFTVPGKNWRRLKPEIVAARGNHVDLGIVEESTGAALIVTCMRVPDGRRWDMEQRSAIARAVMMNDGARTVNTTPLNDRFDEGRLFLAESPRLGALAFAVLLRGELCIDVYSACPLPGPVSEQARRVICSFAPSD